MLSTNWAKYFAKEHERPTSSSCSNAANSQSNPKTRALAAIPGGTIIGPDIEVVKIIDKYGIEVAIQSISIPENTSYVVISTETDRFVNEIHNHKTDARSNSELHEDFPNQKEMNFIKKEREPPALRKLGQLQA